MKRHFIVLTVAAALAMALSSFACGNDDAVTQQPTATTTSNRQESSQDRAARLAAQTQLRNAQTDQELYYSEKDAYAGSASELKSVDARLSGKVVVDSGSATGYEMSVTASDAAGTKYILRRTSSGVERLDGEGNSW
ncbi:MAG: hypothetical protein ACYC6B_09805 [Thermoleophilia bacterium]